MTDPLAEVLRGLRREYLRDSVARVEELERLRPRVEQGDTEALDLLRRALHKLAGSAGSYGFGDISRESRAGEQVARRLIESRAAPGEDDLAALRQTVAAVSQGFAAARAAEGDLGA